MSKVTQQHKALDREQRHLLICKRCGHRWLSRKADPVACPNIHCKSRYWNKDYVLDVDDPRRKRQR